jgi:hypothetical protein
MPGYSNIDKPGGGSPALDIGRLLSLQGFQGPDDDYSGSTWSSGGINMTRDQQTGKWGNLSSDDPAIQKAISGGGFSYNTGASENTHASVGMDTDKLMSLLPQTKYGGYGSFRPTNVNVDDAGKATINGKGWDVRDSSATTWDPNYGWITPNANVRVKDDIFDTLGGQILPMLIAGGMGLGGASLIGGLGGSLFGGIPKLGNLIGNKDSDPLDAVTSLLKGSFDGGQGGIMSMISDLLKSMPGG